MKLTSILAMLALFACAEAHAEKHRQFIDEAEPQVPSSVQEGEGWKEQDTVSLPPWPKDGDLVEFQLDNDSRPWRNFIDGKNLKAGSDGVVRYTLVVESSSGARNVSFEGIRCSPKGDYKIYAYGTDGSFRAVPGEEWQGIAGIGGDQLHRELHRHFLCIPLKFQARPKKDMLRALNGHIHPRQNTGFLPD
jgi:hypothetical protein